MAAPVVSNDQNLPGGDSASTPVKPHPERIARQLKFYFVFVEHLLQIFFSKFL
jgi:hypothetical protein